jgi:beta-lactamase regulating signal transducer with metallopeptidase domain
MQDFMEYRLLSMLLKVSWQAALVILLVLAVQHTLGRRWRPRWRHALWWLVVARLALPETISSPVSLFNIFPSSGGATRIADTVGDPSREQVQPPADDAAANPASVPPKGGVASLWLCLWVAGALFMAVCLGTNHYRIHRRVTRRRPLIVEPVLNLLEDCKQRMGVRTPITLVETAAVDGPCLFGVLRPRLLLPPGFLRGFSFDELRYVFLHELGHVKRHDNALGWLMAVLQILHWFNPLVWLAFSRMRVDRELACDALALSHAEDRDHKPYGRTIVKLLENFGNAVRAPSLAGIVEDKQQMKERIIMIAKFHKSNGGFAVAVSLLAGLGLVTLTDAQTGANPSITATEDAAAPPRIIATSPKIGSKDVDPALKEITVTFDRDMGGGMSWTGGGPGFPQSPQGAKAHWRDKRICVLPVKLQPGHYYRVGINSPSYQNFRSANDIAATPTAITFKTSGTAVESKAPEIVSLTPTDGASDVSPALTELRVTFNVAMGVGFSWTGGGPNYPTIPDGKKPYWTKDGKTCVLPVALKPDSEYKLGLNSPSYKGFQSDEGVPLKPVGYTFKTSDKP